MALIDAVIHAGSLAGVPAVAMTGSLSGIIAGLFEGFVTVGLGWRVSSGLPSDAKKPRNPEVARLLYTTD
ncbi:hypothetical protein J3P91_20825 [Pseudomonas sp. Z4-7]|uniref:hypothetical protein n=1 Tax=Pseudomonas sp. Z4-7 TaxID=2817413 RepID=UPI003DA99198